RASTRHRSREANHPPSFANLPTQKVREAERRQALGCLRGTRSRASHVGPQGEIARPCVPAQLAYASHAPGDARLSALHRDGFLAPGPPGETIGHWRPRCRVAAFAGPARSGGRAVSPGRLPGVVVTSQPAGRRIPLRLWLVSGDALGERDGGTI